MQSNPLCGANYRSPHPARSDESCHAVRATLYGLASDGLDGLFGDDDADAIVAIVRSFNQTVEMTFESA